MFNFRVSIVLITRQRILKGWKFAKNTLLPADEDVLLTYCVVLLPQKKIRISENENFPVKSGPSNKDIFEVILLLMTVIIYFEQFLTVYVVLKIDLSILKYARLLPILRKSGLHIKMLLFVANLMNELLVESLIYKRIERWTY